YARYFEPKPDTWHKMLDILCYWASKGVDAFRCDMAHMVPLEFWHWAITEVKKRYPGIQFIAEIYDVALYRPYIEIGGFDYLYDKVTLYDTLRGIQAGHLSAAQITSCWQTIDGMSDHMLNFLENHDEQRFASKFYAGNAAVVTPSLVVSSMISTAPFMIYMGQELGEPGADAEGFSGADGRTTIFDYWSIDTLRRWYNGGKCDGDSLTDAEKWLRDRYRAVLRLLNSEPAIASGRFFDLMYVNYHNPSFDPHRQFAFLRHYGSDTLLIVVNFGDQSASVSVNIPEHAFDCLGIRPGLYEAEELLTGRRQSVELSADKQFATEIGPHDAVIWKLSDNKIEQVGKKSCAKGAMKAKK
ncbi:MAG: alpha-amylase, partial [Muribaculaceae bacterium]|nr:alpha-amylase [Muribaculaceae bacterium]